MRLLATPIRLRTGQSERVRPERKLRVARIARSKEYPNVAGRKGNLETLYKLDTLLKG